jgi:methionyl-tRNA formyltransferase
MKKPLRTIFMGTPDFSVPTLNKLIESADFEIIAVFTQADKVAGRGQKIKMSPVKNLAMQHNITVYQPEKIKSEVETIKALNPDLIVVIAYGKIIPQSILDIPTYGCINIHASLLPKYRGASCLQAPILNGDMETGVTIMKMDAHMDTGPIINQAKINLDKKETLETLHNKLSVLGAETIIPSLLDYCDNKIEARAQDNSQASYVNLTSKEDGHIEPGHSADFIARQIRALNPWPGTYLQLNNGEKIKILSAELKLEDDEDRRIGEIYKESNNIYLRCGQNSLHILKLQRENRKALDASEFLKGNQAIIGLTSH